MKEAVSPTSWFEIIFESCETDLIGRRYLEFLLIAHFSVFEYEIRSTASDALGLKLDRNGEMTPKAPKGYLVFGVISRFSSQFNSEGVARVRNREE